MYNLMYIKENPYIRFGYDYSEIDNEIADKYGIIGRQANDETRDEFFERIGARPEQNEYGYNENLDFKINTSCDEDELDEIFESGYALDRFVCGWWGTKICAAEHGYCLDKLVGDKDEDVRLSVARQGYGLDKLVNDENKYVRETAVRKKYNLNK